jgi:hypothetical protein
MLDVVAQSAAINLLYFLVALLIAWLVLLWLDRRLSAGRTIFSVHFRKMQDAPVALAIYLGLRFLGICWLAGSFLHG